MSFAEIVEKIRDEIVVIRTANGSTGTGIVLDNRGLVVTNSHVVAGFKYVVVQTAKRGLYLGKVVASNSKIDYAFIYCETLSNAFEVYPVFSTRPRLLEGEEVIAIGHPMGLEFTVSKGIVSAACREVNGIKYIQTDVPINPGNSGGPLLDNSGEIIGINTWIIGNAQSLSFAIPASYIREAYASLPAAEILKEGEYCTFCGRLNKVQGSYCSSCGAELVKESIPPALAAGTGFCVSCLMQNEPAAKYCQRCGALLQTAAPAKEEERAEQINIITGPIVCPVCGLNNEGTKYCGRCGALLVN